MTYFANEQNGFKQLSLNDSNTNFIEDFRINVLYEIIDVEHEFDNSGKPHPVVNKSGMVQGNAKVSGLMIQPKDGRRFVLVMNQEQVNRTYEGFGITK